MLECGWCGKRVRAVGPERLRKMECPICGDRLAVCSACHDSSKSKACMMCNAEPDDCPRKRGGDEQRC